MKDPLDPPDLYQRLGRRGPVRRRLTIRVLLIAVAASGVVFGIAYQLLQPAVAATRGSRERELRTIAPARPATG